MDNVEIQNLIKELIEKTTVKMDKISITEDTGTNTWFSVEVNEPHFFITHDGEALYALNHLVRRIIECKTCPMSDLGLPKSDIGQTSSNILIDINGFQKKRVDNIKAIAHMMSERA